MTAHAGGPLPLIIENCAIATMDDAGAEYRAGHVVVTDGLITAVTGYWDQNKLYRRLAVKRLDRIAIA